MNAIDILKEELDDMPKTPLPKNEFLAQLLEGELHLRPCAVFRRQIQSWKFCCLEGEQLVAHGANEWVIYGMLKRHLELIVGHHATTDLGREAGSHGYELCAACWTALGAGKTADNN